MPGGRPTKYSKAMADRICELTATNPIGLTRLCKKYDDLPDKDTVNVWRHKYPEFSAQYAQAKLKQADLLAEEIIEIADDVSQDTLYDSEGNERCNAEWVARSRLRIDSRKWLASKLLPKQYGDAAKHDEKENEKSILEKILNGEITINK